MRESMSTAHAVAKHGHIQAAKGSSGTASFGAGYKASADGGGDDDIEREYNLRASQIKAKFEKSGRQEKLAIVSHMSMDSLITGSLNDRDADDDDDNEDIDRDQLDAAEHQLAASASNFNRLELPEHEVPGRKQRPLSSIN